MESAVEGLTGIGVGAWNTLAPLAIEGTVLVAVVGAAMLVARRAPACLKYALWVLVLIKLVVPLPFGLPEWNVSPVQYIPTPVVIHGDQEIAYAYPAMLVLPAPAAAPAEPSAPSVDPQIAAVSRVGVAGSAWAISGLAMLLFRLMRYRRMRKLFLRIASPASTELAALTEAVRLQIGLRRAVTIVEAEELDSPLVLGFLRPLVLMPARAVRDLDAAELRSLLAHELFHLKRRDHWVLPLELLAVSLHWFNPAAWLVVRGVRRERERACDDAVMAFLGEAEADYSAGLVKVARMHNRGNAQVSGSLALFEGRADLEARIRRMAVPARKVAPRMGALSTVLVIALGCAWLPGGGRMSGKQVAPDEQIDYVQLVRDDAKVRKAAGEISEAVLTDQVSEHASRSLFGPTKTVSQHRVIVTGANGKFRAEVEVAAKRGRRTVRIAGIRPATAADSASAKVAAANEDLRSIENAQRKALERGAPKPGFRIAKADSTARLSSGATELRGGAAIELIGLGDMPSVTYQGERIVISADGMEAVVYESRLSVETSAPYETRITIRRDADTNLYTWDFATNGKLQARLTQAGAAHPPQIRDFRAAVADMPWIENISAGESSVDADGNLVFSRQVVLELKNIRATARRLVIDPASNAMILTGSPQVEQTETDFTTGLEADPITLTPGKDGKIGINLASGPHEYGLMPTIRTLPAPRAR